MENKSWVDVQGGRFLVEFLDSEQEEMMVSLWSAELEDFVASGTCLRDEVGAPS